MIAMDKQENLGSLERTYSSDEDMPECGPSPLAGDASGQPPVPTVSDVLHALVAAQEPPTVELLCWMLGGVQQADVEELLGSLSDFFSLQPVSGQMCVVARHKSVIDFITDPQRSGDDYVDPVEAHRRLAAACVQFLDQHVDSRMRRAAASGASQAIRALVQSDGAGHASLAGLRGLLAAAPGATQAIITYVQSHGADHASLAGLKGVLERFQWGLEDHIKPMANSNEVCSYPSESACPFFCSCSSCS